eukprot:5322971-Prymnesium_polylepis.1
MRSGGVRPVAPCENTGFHFHAAPFGTPGPQSPPSPVARIIALPRLPGPPPHCPLRTAAPLAPSPPASQIGECCYVMEIRVDFA